jgi:alpha-D-xyloside xylohydrolase
MRLVLLLLLVGMAAAARTGGVTALHCEQDAATYRIEPWGANSIRVRVGADPIFELPQQALLPSPPKPIGRTVSEGAECAATSGNLKAELLGGRLRFTDVSTGKLLLSENAHSVCAGSACESKMAGVKASVAPTGSISFASSADERLFGLGEHRTGRLDNHGLSLDFMDAGVYDHHHAGDIILPWYLSSKQYGFMWNMASFGAFNSTDTEIVWSSVSTPVLDFWVTTSGAAKPGGNPFKTMLGQFADATGHPPKSKHTSNPLPLGIPLSSLDRRPCVYSAGVCYGVLAVQEPLPLTDGAARRGQGVQGTKAPYFYNRD